MEHYFNFIMKCLAARHRQNFKNCHNNFCKTWNISRRFSLTFENTNRCYDCFQCAELLESRLAMHEFI